MVYAHGYNLNVWNNLKNNRPEFNKIYKEKNNRLLTWLISSYISSFLLKQFRKKVFFFGDSKSISILKNANAFYDEYINLEDDLIDDYKFYWSYAKIKSMQYIDETFVFVDNDLFLYKSIEDFFAIGDVLCDQEEEIKYFKTYIAPAILALRASRNLNNKLDIPTWSLFIKNHTEEGILDISSFKNDFAFNCGLLGFKDSILAKDYSQQSIEIYRNLAHNINYYMEKKLVKHVPTFFEQYMLKKYCEVKNIRPICLNFLNKVYATDPYYFHLLEHKPFITESILIEKAKKIINSNLTIDYFLERI